MVRAELIEWARQNFERGHSVDQIRESLKNAGYPAPYTEEVIRVGVGEIAEVTGALLPEEVKEEENIVINPLFEGGGSREEVTITEGEPEETSQDQEAKETQEIQEVEEFRERGNFLSRHIIGIALLFVVLLAIIALSSMFVNVPVVVKQPEPTELPTENIPVEVLSEALQNHPIGIFPSFMPIKFLLNDEVKSSDLTPATGGTPLMFCTGQVKKPSSCDQEEWDKSSPCSEEYLFTSEANSEFFSADTDHGRFKVQKDVSGNIRISKVCGIYYIGFK